MKKFITLFIMATLAVGTMMAKWQSSDTEATRLDGNAVYQVQMKTLRTDDGKIILTWLRSENTNGVYSYKLHLQVFDAEGDAMFGDEGIIVCDKRTRSWTTDYGLALASNGDILLAYTDIRNDPTEENAESYLYRYTQQGEPVWGVDGILFPSEKIHENAFVVEDVAPAICVSGDNIYAAVSHTEYYMEEANENNWSPSPWNPGQQMPDSVQVDETSWLLVALNNDGTVKSEAPMTLATKILTMNAASEGNVYIVYNNESLGLEGQLLDGELINQWPNPATIETSPLSSGIYMPTPQTAVDDEDILILSYEVLTDFYGYQVVNYLSPWGYSPEAVSLAGGIDGDASGGILGVKVDKAFVAWEYAYSSSEYRMNVNEVDDQNNYCWSGDHTYGVTLETNDMWGYKPVKVIPVEDGWVVLYGNCTSWNGANFMVVKMNETGDVIWSKQICEDNFKSSGFAVTYDKNHAYIFYTQDPDNKATSGGMYVMCVLIGEEEPSSIDTVQTSNLVNSTEIFTIDGRRVDTLQPGVNIVRTTDENGIVTTKKVMK